MLILLLVFSLYGTGDVLFDSIGKKNCRQLMSNSTQVECIFCPPDPHPDDGWCQWIFSIPEL